MSAWLFLWGFLLGLLVGIPIGGYIWYEMEFKEKWGKNDPRDDILKGK